ncbi:MAG: hypothetical protein F6K18_30345 [Okeania sp. SIO2C2]|uniref:hypothetical protein n=1 Tax=Okeania sp. SIO2C2 TaxID=2607787 RepID=UPI0013B68E2E|nr:hypothetical protein [Okeania sp. SIO2C2]NEP90767.1 hypothetical protein [Okeania sp. SIO2C2]
MQSVVIHTSTGLKPIQQLSLLVGIWIDSVGVVHRQHSCSLPQAIATGKCLSHRHRADEISAGSPCIPTLMLRIQRGTYSSPNPSLVKLCQREIFFSNTKILVIAEKCKSF